MEVIRIGVLGPSEIAFRRTVPAFVRSQMVEYVGVAHASCTEWSDTPVDESVISVETDKCKKFREKFGGRIISSYHELLDGDIIDAVYIPLPPGLHRKWTYYALLNGKHVLVEKPFTTEHSDTKKLIDYASDHSLAVHENYAFAFHRQIAELDRIVAAGEIGELRFIRSSFAFPYRGANDFRYYRSMGGGAIIDCGGYPVRLASHFLNGTITVKTSSLLSSRGHDVDVFGSVTLADEDDITAQLFFGMDNSYKCDIELYGSIGAAYTERVFSPPAEMETKITVIGPCAKEIFIEPDDQFLHSVEYFCGCIENESLRKNNYTSIINQAQLIEIIKSKGEAQR